MVIHRAWITYVIGCLLLLLSGCVEKEQRSLSLAFSEEAHYQIFHFLDEPHLAGQFEFDFELFPTTSPAETTRLFRNGIVDFAALDLNGALRIAESGNVTILGIIGRMQGTRALLAREGFTSVSDLRGRRIGAYMVANRFLENILAAEGMSSADVEFVYIPHMENEKLLELANVDAVVSFEPQATRLKRAGFRELYNASNTDNAPIYVIIGRTDLIKEQPLLAEALIDGWTASLISKDENGGLVAAMFGPKIGLLAQEFDGLFNKFEANPDLRVGWPENFVIVPEPLAQRYLEAIQQGHGDSASKMQLYWEL